MEALGLSHQLIGGQRRSPRIFALLLEKEVGGERHEAPDRPAQHLRDRAPGRLADQVEAGRFDRREHPRIAADQHPESLDLVGIGADDVRRGGAQLLHEEPAARSLAETFQPVRRPQPDHRPAQSP